MPDLTTAEQAAARPKRRPRPAPEAQAASVASAGASATVVQAPQAIPSDPQVWVAIGRLQEADEVHTRDLTSVRTDIASLTREGGRHTAQLAGIEGAVAALPAIADAMRQIGESVAKLEARPELTPAAAAYTELLARDWTPDVIANRTREMAGLGTFMAQIVAERADVAAALVVSDQIAVRHAEVNGTIQMAILGTLAGLTTAVLLMLLAKAPPTVQAGAALALAAGLAGFIFFVRKTLLRIRGIGSRAARAASPPPPHP